MISGCVLKDNPFQLRWWYKNANIFNTIQTCVGGGKEKVHLDNQSSASPKLELIILLSSVIGNSSSPNLSPLWWDKSNEVLMSFCSTNIEMWCKVVQGKYTDLNVKNHLWCLRCYFWGRWGPATEGLDLMIMFIVSSKKSSLLNTCSFKLPKAYQLPRYLFAFTWKMFSRRLFGCVLTSHLVAENSLTAVFCSPDTTQPMEH